MTYLKNEKRLPLKKRTIKDDPKGLKAKDNCRGVILYYENIKRHLMAKANDESKKDIIYSKLVLEDVNRIIGFHQQHLRIIE